MPLPAGPLKVDTEMDGDISSELNARLLVVIINGTIEFVAIALVEKRAAVEVVPPSPNSLVVALMVETSSLVDIFK